MSTICARVVPRLPPGYDVRDSDESYKSQLVAIDIDRVRPEGIHRRSHSLRLGGQQMHIPMANPSNGSCASSSRLSRRKALSTPPCTTCHRQQQAIYECILLLLENSPADPQCASLAYVNNLFVENLDNAHSLPASQRIPPLLRTQYMAWLLGVTRCSLKDLSSHL